MKLSDMIEKKYLAKEDVLEKPMLVVIDRFVEENVAKEGNPPEMKWIVYFRNLKKGMVLNPTNNQLLQAIFNTNDSTALIGREIVLFNDPNVQMHGKLTGGIRIRAPRRPAAPAQAASAALSPVQPNPVPDIDPTVENDDVPF